MEDLINRAFANCTVQDSEIVFNETFSQDEMHQIYERFTADLLNCKIPHYRVVGFAYPSNGVVKTSMFKTNPMFRLSPIELGFKLSCIVPEKIGGNNPVRGCYYNYLTDIESNHQFDRAYGNPTFGVDSRRANALTVSHEIVGQLACGSEYPPTTEDGEPILNEDCVVTTDNLWYMQYGIAECAEYPKMLIPHKTISDLIENRTKPWIHIFYMKGTGRLSYEDNQTLFRRDWHAMVPCTTEYDLSKFFVCKYPDGDLDRLKLTYLESINESVLNTILVEYGLGVNT